MDLRQIDLNLFIIFLEVSKKLSFHLQIKVTRICEYIFKKRKEQKEQKRSYFKNPAWGFNRCLYECVPLYNSHQTGELRGRGGGIINRPNGTAFIMEA